MPFRLYPLLPYPLVTPCIARSNNQISVALQLKTQITSNWHVNLIAGTWGTLATFPFGLFAGIILSAQFIGLYNCAPKQHMATAISMYYMSQQVGIALGISITSSLMMQRFQATLLKNLVHVPGYEEVSVDASPSFKKQKYLIWFTDHQEYLNWFIHCGSTSYRSQSFSKAELSEQFLGCTKCVIFHPSVLSK